MPTYRPAKPKQIALAMDDEHGRVEQVVGTRDGTGYEFVVKHPRGEVTRESVPNVSDDDAIRIAHGLLSRWHGQFVGDRARGEKPAVVVSAGAHSAVGGVVEDTGGMPDYQSRLKYRRAT